ncbi:MAG: insulinase family protein, partial [Candidatus Binatia bacterium]
MKEQPTPQSVEHEATTVFSTDNGMEVLIREDHFAPVVAMQVWVKAGSTDESDAEAGVAHVHEHMLFKGTARRGVGEIAGEVESAGGRINAWTSWDQTVYHIVLASRYAEQGLDILADAVQHSSFDPNELNKELGVVMEEYKRGQDMPGTRLFHTLFATAFEKHPYRRPVIGTEQSITHLTREKVLDFFSRFYAPNNMALIIVGDVDTERVKAQIHEEFDGFESRKIEKPVRPSEDPQDELRYESLRMDVKESHLAVAFHIPDANHDDAPLLDMVSFVLGGGEGSRLYRRLVAEAELANSVSAFAYTPVDPGLFVITASLEDEKLLGTLEGILDETAELRARPLTAEELKRARHNLKADFIYRRQTVQGQAREIGYLLTVHNDLEYDRRYLQRLDAITLEEVQQAALRYFDRNNLTVVSLLPNDSPSQLSRTDVEAAATALDAGREASASKSEERAARAEKTARPPVARTGSGPAELVTLDNGVRIVVQEHHDAPLFSVRVGMIGGLLAETPDNNGVSSFVAEMLTRGTARYSREELSTRIESLASDLSGFSGRN